MQKIQFRSSENLNIDFDFIHFFLSTNICSLWFRLQIYRINEIITRNVEQINCNCNYLLIKNTFGIMRKCCDYRFAWNRWKCDNIFIDFFSFLVFYAKMTFSHFRIVHLAFSVVFVEDQWITLINNGSWACSLWPFLSTSVSAAVAGEPLCESVRIRVYFIGLLISCTLDSVKYINHWLLATFFCQFRLWRASQNWKKSTKQGEKTNAVDAECKYEFLFKIGFLFLLSEIHLLKFRLQNVIEFDKYILFRTSKYLHFSSSIAKR